MPILIMVDFLTFRSNSDWLAEMGMLKFLKSAWRSSLKGKGFYCSCISSSEGFLVSLQGLRADCWSVGLRGRSSNQSTIHLNKHNFPSFWWFESLNLKDGTIFRKTLISEKKKKKTGKIKSKLSISDCKRFTHQHYFGDQSWIIRSKWQNQHNDVVEHVQLSREPNGGMVKMNHDDSWA